jgi:DNA polymerase-3 subunit alpha
MDVKFTKKDNRAFATFTLEDFSGTAEAIAWNESYEKYKELIKDGAPIGVRARCKKDDRTEATMLIVQEIKPLKPKAAKDNGTVPNGVPVNGDHSPLVLTLDGSRHGANDLEAIGQTLAAHPGAIAIHFNIRLPSGKAVKLAAAPEWCVEDCESLRDGLEAWLK